MTSRHELTKKYGPKVVMKNFLGAKSLTKCLGRLKRKVGTLIGIKNIFNSLFFTNKLYY